MAICAIFGCDLFWDDICFFLFLCTVMYLLKGASFSGQIGYALVPMIARGVMLGADQPVILHMLDIPPAAEALNGVKMELVDAAFPLLKGSCLCFLCSQCIAIAIIPSLFRFF